MHISLCPFCMSEVQSEICPNCGKEIRYSGYPGHLFVGYTLSGRSTYVFGASLGQGGFGITYIALDTENGQRVAIKEYYPSHCCVRENSTIVFPGYGQEETFSKGKQHFLLEAQMLQSLSDLGSVVKVLDYFEANNSAYLVMEYLDGLSLKEYVERNGKLPAQQFLTKLKPLMADMEKMHQRGVVHRDIAPDNIILLPDGRLKLIDFGAARSYVGDKSMTVVVKKGFAPVEQYMRKGSNASTDVYALAATIYYCITGIIPPDSAERQYGEASLQAPTALGVELSSAQERGLEKALEIQPKVRTQSVTELAKALAQAPKPAPPKPEKPKPAPKKEKPPKTVGAPNAESKKKVNWIIPAAVAAIVLICAGAGIMLVGTSEPSSPEMPVQMEVVQTLPPEAQPVLKLSPEAQKYNEAVDFFKNGEYGKAAIAFGKLGNYKDAKEISLRIWDAIADRNTIDAGYGCTLAVREDGTVVACGQYAPDVSELTDIIALAGSYMLKADGTVLYVTGRGDTTEIILTEYTDVVAIDSWTYDISFLKADGTVVFDAAYPGWWYTEDELKELDEKKNKISSLQDVIACDFQSGFVKLADGTVLIDLEISENQNIVDVCCTNFGTATLFEDGTMEFIPEKLGWRYDEELAEETKADIGSWENIVSICNGGGEAILAVKADGTVVAAGLNDGARPLDVYKWNDVVAVAASDSYSVGLRSDGTLVTAGNSGLRERQTYGMDNIRLPADRDALLAAIELDYITE